MSKHRADDMTLTLTPLGRRMDELTRRSGGSNVGDPRFAELHDHIRSISDTVRQSVAVLSAQQQQTQARCDALLGHLERQARQTDEVIAASHSYRAAANATAELANDVRAMRAEVRSNAGLLTGAQAVLEAGVRRMQAGGDALERLLEDRDREKDAERDQRVRDVLENFAAGLRAREKRSLARRLLASLDQRRSERTAAARQAAGPAQADSNGYSTADAQLFRAQPATRRTAASHLRSARNGRAAPAVIDLDAAVRERRASPRY